MPLIISTILLCLLLAGCPAHTTPPSGYQTRMLCVDYEDKVVDVDWIEPSRVQGEPDRCGTLSIDYGRWTTMTEDEVFKEMMRDFRDSDTRFGAACAKKGK